MKHKLLAGMICVSVSLSAREQTNKTINQHTTKTDPEQGIVTENRQRIMTYETVMDESYQIRRQLSSLAFDPHERKASVILGSVQQLIVDARITFMNAKGPGFLTIYIQELHKIAVKLSETYQVIIERMDVARTHADWHEQNEYETALTIVSRLYNTIETEIVMYEEYILQSTHTSVCAQRSRTTVRQS